MCNERRIIMWTNTISLNISISIIIQFLFLLEIEIGYFYYGNIDVGIELFEGD